MSMPSTTTQNLNSDPPSVRGIVRLVTTIPDYRSELTWTLHSGPGLKPILRPPIDQRYMAPAARSQSSGNNLRIFTFIDSRPNTLEQRQRQLSST
jgi:hypothetical protein